MKNESKFPDLGSKWHFHRDVSEEKQVYQVVEVCRAPYIDLVRITWNGCRSPSGVSYGLVEFRDRFVPAPEKVGSVTNNTSVANSSSVAGKYSYHYPMPSVTVDAVIFLFDHILLIQRKEEPFKHCWALPGGYMNINESLAYAVCREVQEETGLRLKSGVYIGAADGVDRDPRGRVISHYFMADVTLKEGLSAKAGDDARALCWYKTNELPKLAFDHQIIIDSVLSFRSKNK